MHGAKLAAALATLAESSLVLVRGKEGWRIAGAVLEENWFARMGQPTARDSVARVSGLLLRLIAGEVNDPRLFSVIVGFFEALSTISEDAYEDAEALAVLRVLAILGLDAGAIPGEASEFTPDALSALRESRTDYIARINHGISASGL